MTESLMTDITMTAPREKGDGSQVYERPAEGGLRTAKNGSADQGTTLKFAPAEGGLWNGT